MSIATITIADCDLETGKFKVDVNVDDVTDGFASAAHVTSMFISKAVATPEFAEGAAAYGQAKGYSLRKDSEQTVILTLTDVDLDAGSFDLKVTENEDAIIEGSVTPAYLCAMFLRDAMPSVEFRMAVTEFAYSLTQNVEGASVNEPTLQIADNSNTTEQEVA